MNGWPIVYFASYEDAVAAGAEHRPGTCYPDTLHERHPGTFQLSEKYRRDHQAGRQALTVVCPGGNAWQIDCLAIGADGPQGEGWTITGSAQEGTLTASPSINFPGRYHGWLQYGRLTEDTEGRRFDAEGTLQ